MSQQRHDRGWQKRHIAPRTRSGRIDGGRLARDLVERGISDPIILGNIAPRFNRNTH